MRNLLSVSNMRKSDAHTIENLVSSEILMYRAGIGIKLAMEEYDLFEDSFVFIVCGSGNNAGDGFVLAGLLKSENIPVALCLVSDNFSKDGKFYYDSCVKANVPIVKYPNFSIKALNPKEYFEGKKGRIIVVDCLLGTGFKGSPREPIASAIEEINYIKDQYEEDIFVVSVDINSGLNGDNGMGDNCVISDLTVSIGDLKPGLFLNRAKDIVGEIINADIGIEPIDEPYYLLDGEDVRGSLPIRMNDSNKGTYGYIALIGGSFRYQGASVLATNACCRTSTSYEKENIPKEANRDKLILADNGNAAMRSGAGVVMLAAPRSICPLIIPKIMESTIFPLSEQEGEVVFNQSEIDELMHRVKTIAFGMGIGNTPESEKILKYLLENYSGLLIIDADGLNCLSKMSEGILLRAKCSRIVLTPHLKEFERLSGKSISQIKEDSIELAKKYARDNNVIVLLKGPSTIVTNGDRVLITDRGCPGMATAGSGDVLAGILAALCASNLSVKEDLIQERQIEHLLLTVASGAYINGLAGERAEEEYGSISMLAGDTVNFIHKAIKEILC